MFPMRPGRCAFSVGREATVDRAEIAIIKVLHRPCVSWRACEVLFGCSCGADTHPCPVLATALEAERRAGSRQGTPHNLGRFDR
jgi:hypothetical protein